MAPRPAPRASQTPPTFHFERFFDFFWFDFGKMMSQFLFIAGSRFCSEVTPQQVHFTGKIRTGNLGTVAGSPKASGYNQNYIEDNMKILNLKSLH